MIGLLFSVDSEGNSSAKFEYERGNDEHLKRAEKVHICHFRE